MYNLKAVPIYETFNKYLTIIEQYVIPVQQ